MKEVHGSNHSTWVSVPSEKFKTTKGEEKTTSFRAGEFNTTYFCSNCGTKVYSLDSGYPFTSVLRGTITSPLNIEVTKEWLPKIK